MNSLKLFRRRILKSAVALILYLGTNQHIQAQGGFYNTTPPPTTARPSVDLLRATLLNGNKNPGYVFLALHRAAWIDGTPENSILAVSKAANNRNVDMIEIDLKTSKDGKVYLMHDDYLQRTTNFLDLYPNKYGTGKDNYGKASEYSWDELSRLRLKNEEKTYTNEKIPLLQEAITVALGAGVFLQLDINDDRTFQEAMKVVQAANAFSIVMFKGNKTPNQFTPFFNQLTEAQKKQIIFAPFVKIDSTPDGTTTADPMKFYEQWESWRRSNPTYTGVAGLYEMVFKTPADTGLFLVAEKIRAGGKRTGTFSAQPEYYRGRYIGNVNINQCCANTPENDRRGDFDFILAPNNNRNAGINGYIITDEVTTFLEYFPNRVIQ
ncbi:glycerophosphodiester phosphodiesterase family protein [Chryseobacterium sp. WG14]|uniref:glycerophosphodiester phosphodiesterase family protein n=1 Tax=unclassified Chryseobacterium TaxID=2593645 RepID=UPI00211E08C3|nr:MULTISPECIES: glycerophosphodiester phosphodiesterase family protein [unclassified Chryseobacterium]MCQ9633442.1 glycerophosphodiester phosphodiesterase family protein [Chryseobacterium sp. WG23]MCQ9639700.1 glycerophosphodiester phosphodiesterase family protein [Chryseobacterium sp. WG14]